MKSNLYQQQLVSVQAVATTRMSIARIHTSTRLGKPRRRATRLVVCPNAAADSAPHSMFDISWRALPPDVSELDAAHYVLVPRSTGGKT